MNRKKYIEKLIKCFENSSALFIDLFTTGFQVQGLNIRASNCFHETWEIKVYELKVILASIWGLNNPEKISIKRLQSNDFEYLFLVSHNQKLVYVEKIYIDEENVLQPSLFDVDSMIDV